MIVRELFPSPNLGLVTFPLF